MTALIPIIPDRDRRRLISTCGLFASDKDNEVVAAARAACRLLEPHGLTVANLVEVALTPRPMAWPQTSRLDPVRAGEHQALARRWLASDARLNGWEVDFLLTITRWDGPLSAKQRAALDRIEAKIARGARSC